MCKWLLTARSNFVCFMNGYETRTLDIEETHTNFYVSVLHIVRGKFEGCRDLHRSISVVRVVRFMKL